MKHLLMLQRDLEREFKALLPGQGSKAGATRRAAHKAAAEDGWKRCLAWFKAHGVA